MSADRDLESLLESWQSCEPEFIVPERFATALQLSQSEFARLAGVHPSVIAGRPDNSKLQQFMRNTVRVLCTYPNPQGAWTLFCYRNLPIREFEYRTGEELVSMGKAHAFVSYLLSSASGSSG